LIIAFLLRYLSAAWAASTDQGFLIACFRLIKVRAFVSDLSSPGHLLRKSCSCFSNTFRTEA
jgi:hypothetical protein